MAAVVRFRFLIGFLVVLIPGVAIGSLAYAGRDTSRLPAAAMVGGVDVGSLTREEVRAKLRRTLGRPAGRSVVVHVGSRDFRLSAADAGVTLDIPQAINSAFDDSAQGNVVQRGWRSLMGERRDVDVPVHVTADPKAVRSFVGRVHAAVSHKPSDASLDIQVRHVDVTQSKTGLRLAGRDDLVKRIDAALQSPGGRRDFTANTAVVEPKVSGQDLWGSNPIVVTVSKTDKLVRVFDRGKLVKRFKVAVGMKKYPTPDGQFSIQSMQKNPVWSVPNSDWAGDLAGKVIPGGSPDNPLKARFIGFDGAVGFHGTSNLGSLGSAASHGCVRMNPTDVKDLFDRVGVGTPVLVGS